MFRLETKRKQRIMGLEQQIYAQTKEWQKHRRILDSIMSWTSAFLNRQHITNIVDHLVPNLHKPLKKLRTLSTILLGLTLIGRTMSTTMHIYIHTYLHTNAGNSNIGLKTAKGN